MDLDDVIGVERVNKSQYKEMKIYSMLCNSKTIELINLITSSPRTATIFPAAISSIGNTEGPWVQIKNYSCVLFFNTAKY